MSAFLTLHNLSLTTPDDRLLIQGLDLAFGAERTGIVGPNGCGKSTLLAVLAGNAPPAAGGLTRAGRTGLLAQVWPDLGVTAAAALGVAPALDRLGRIEAGQGSEADFAAADWDLPARVAAALARAGLEGHLLTRPLATLSGGQRTRVGLARLWLAAPDLLLLDEPTNSLDTEGRALVAELIASWPGGVVVVSHDRALLAGVDRILELGPKGAVLVGGGWEAYAAERAARLAREETALSRAEHAQRHTAQAVQRQRERKARRDAAGRAARAKGDAPKVLLDKQAERAEKSGARDRAIAARLEAAAGAARAAAAAAREVRPALRIGAEAGAAHGLAARLIGVTARRGGFRLGPLSLDMAAGEHLALQGPNGAGKSTLLALLRGEIAAETGTLQCHGPVAGLNQDAAGFAPDLSLIDGLCRLHRGLTPQAARAMLARFGFRAAAGERRPDRLSGGERLRAGLAAALGGVEPPRLLTLDEPSNHLDLDTLELLEAALADYKGAVLVASHDRAFLHNIGIDRRLRLSGGRLI